MTDNTDTEPNDGAECNNCLYFNENKSRCERYPPIVLMTARGEATFWPDVVADDYCGEWKRE